MVPLRGTFLFAPAAQRAPPSVGYLLFFKVVTSSTHTLCNTRPSSFPLPCEQFEGANPLGAVSNQTFQPCEHPRPGLVRRPPGLGNCSITQRGASLLFLSSNRLRTCYPLFLKQMLYQVSYGHAPTSDVRTQWFRLLLRDIMPHTTYLSPARVLSGMSRTTLHQGTSGTQHYHTVPSHLACKTSQDDTTLCLSTVERSIGSGGYHPTPRGPPLSGRDSLISPALPV